MYAFIAAMMAAAVWLTIATRFGLPVSTTHSIIGGILGVGLILEVQHSESLIDWEVVQKVVMSWVASPLMGGIIAFLSFTVVRMAILEAENPIERSKMVGTNFSSTDLLRSRSCTPIQGIEGLLRKSGDKWLDRRQV